MDAVLQDSWQTLVAVEPASYALVRSCTRARGHFRLLAVVNLILLPAAILAFGDRFYFWSQPLSDLGMPHTASGHTNYASFALFALNMIAGSAIMTNFAWTCRRACATPHSEWKTLLSAVAAGGFLLGIFPHDRFHYLHMAGCAAMVGSLWFLGNLFSAELHALAEKRAAIAVQLVLQFSVLPYAAAYALNASPRQALQKVAIAGLFASLLLATRVLRQIALSMAIRQSRRQASLARA